MVAEAIALLHEGPKLAGLGMERERRRIASAGGERHLVGPISIEALDGGFGLGFDTDVSGRADANEKRAGFGLDHE